MAEQGGDAIGLAVLNLYTISKKGEIMNLEYIGKKTLSKKDLAANKVKVMVPACPVEGCTHKPEERIVIIDGTQWHRYGIQGEFIQDVFPELSVDEREIFISGTHPECWDRLYSDD